MEQKSTFHWIRETHSINNGDLMTNKFSTQDIANLLEQCSEGNTPSESIIAELMKSNFFGQETIANSAIHFLNHFITDEDVRRNDEEYNKECINKLKTYALQLKQMKPSNK